MSQPPKYLTGDAPAIQEFLDKFDVRGFTPPIFLDSLSHFSYREMRLTGEMADCRSFSSTAMVISIARTPGLVPN